MTLKRKIKTDDPEAEFRFANWLKQGIDLISPKNLYLYIGRAGGKTEDIIAERSMEIIYDMPGAYFALVADTYLNAVKIIVPSILKGWDRKGWIEGIHYVTDERPPAHFEKPYKPIHNYKHTITIWNGCVFKLVSMDRPSTGAGDSYQHLFGDEAKYLKEKKLNKLIPAIRGESLRFHKSPFYRGHTFTSDMANPLQGEDDWMWKQAKKMDREQIELILQTAFVVNDVRLELIHTRKEGSKAEIALTEKKLARWEERYRIVRKHSTFFFTASSYINADVLTSEYFTDQMQSLDASEFSVSILSIKPTLEKGARFYVNLGEEHFYSDGIRYDAYDQIKLGNKVIETCAGLKYLDLKRPIEGGFDAGNMMSLVTGQTQGDTVRILKNFHTITPEWIEHLGKKFTEFYDAHENKVLELYYDRAANSYSKAKKDFATQIKQAIEEQDGKRTGWFVRLMSLNQPNITHEQEYDLCLQIMGGTNKYLPKLKIDMYNCRELKSSMENAPVKIIDRGDSQKKIQKDKNSEKLALERLPMESTNYSDAFKYFICRPHWLQSAAQGNNTPSQMSDPRTI